MELELKNFMEDLVTEYLEDILEGRDDVCTCNQCLLDIATYALNKLPPMYFSRAKGMIYSRLEEFENQVRADVIALLTAGINRVQESPKHHE